MDLRKLKEKTEDAIVGADQDSVKKLGSILEMISTLERAGLSRSDTLEEVVLLAKSIEDQEKAEREKVCKDLQKTRAPVKKTKKK